MTYQTVIQIGEAVLIELNKLVRFPSLLNERNSTSAKRNQDRAYYDIINAYPGQQPQALYNRIMFAKEVGIEALNKVNKGDQPAIDWFIGAWRVIRTSISQAMEYLEYERAKVPLPPDPFEIGKEGAPGTFKPDPTQRQPTPPPLPPLPPALGPTPPPPLPPAPGSTKIFGIPQNLVIAGAALLLLPRLLKF